MKHERPQSIRLLLLATLLAAIPPGAFGAVILQGASATHVAFQAEGNATLIAGTPETWAERTDAAAAGGAALIINGTNSTGDSPHSFAQFQIRFAKAGDYLLHYRWRADEARTAGDQFTANSCWFGRPFGAYQTPADQSTYVRAEAANATSAPADNTYQWVREADTVPWTVAAADVGKTVTFTIGTREAGMIIDRVVFSPDTSLISNPAGLDALPDSETDVVVQGANDTYVAFEAEGRGKIIAGTPESWVEKAESAASGGSAITAGGTNSTGDSPHSFVQYQIRFAKAGDYLLHYRWRADEARTAGDQFTANSSWFGRPFGAYQTPGDQTTYVRSEAANATSAPADNTYQWGREADTVPWTVSAADVGKTIIFTIGTREAGMIIDRIVFSPDTTLISNPASLDALPNSGASPLAPELKDAVGSATLKTATVTFTRPLNPSSVTAGSFQLSGGITVSAAAVDAADARIVRLTTGTQAEGTVYTITVNGVKDTAGTSILPNSTTRFTAWKRVNGWVTREIYYGIAGSTVAEFTAAQKYLDRQPDRVDWVRGFQLDRDPRTDNYGARIEALFSPASAGAYDFLVANDDEAEVQLSSDTSEANLQSLGVLPLSARAFSDTSVVSSGSLAAGQRYRLVGLLKQGGGDVYLHVGARAQGDSTPADQISDLAGDRVSTYVNPDLGKVTFTTQPAAATAPAGSRARFDVKVETLATPVYYQWQLNGQDIPGAIRSTYYTAPLTAADSGRKYRVVVSVAGTDTTSNEAGLTVTDGEPSNLVPYLGANFVGGGDSVPGQLIAADVAGAHLQANWNNLAGSTFDPAAPVALLDASGAATPVTFSAAPLTETWYSGTLKTADADGILLQGMVTAGAPTEPSVLRFDGVPAGKYHVLVYTLGFDFSPAYEEDFIVTGAGAPVTITGRAETGLTYVAAPAYRRITGSDPANRKTGNYVQFDEVQPASDGSIQISVAWAGTGGNGHQPAINAVQLVKVYPVTARPKFTGIQHSGQNVVVTWTGGGVLETSGSASGPWTANPGAASPYTAPASGTSTFFRIRSGS